MHGKRLVVAALLLPLLFLYIMKLGPLPFFILLLLVSTIAQAEFYAMYGMGGLLKTAGLCGGIGVLSAMYFSRSATAEILAPVFLAIAAIRLLTKRDPSSSLHDLSPAVVALLYIPSSLGFLIFMREAGPGWILFLFGSVWASDSLAYYIGKTFGKKKLYVEVSPNKTVAGAVGSIMGGALSAWLLDLAFLRTIGVWRSLVIGAVIGAVAIVGDLVESMFKRDAGVKDSSGIIPGHGGILDKIDGALFAGPVLYWMTRIMGI